MKTVQQHAPLMIDIAGTRLQAVDKQRLRHPMVGGMILFGRNWENRAQLTQLCASIKRLRPDKTVQDIDTLAAARRLAGVTDRSP